MAANLCLWRLHSQQAAFAATGPAASLRAGLGGYSSHCSAAGGKDPAAFRRARLESLGTLQLRSASKGGARSCGCKEPCVVTVSAHS